jgi:hypothetical protein
MKGTGRTQDGVAPERFNDSFVDNRRVFTERLGYGPCETVQQPLVNDNTARKSASYLQIGRQVDHHKLLHSPNLSWYLPREEV